MPSKTDQRLQQAVLLNDSGDPAGAVRVLSRLLRAEPANVRALIKLAEIEIQSAQYDSAVLRLDKALRLRRDHPDALAALARALWRQGRLEEALDRVQRAMELEPANGRHRLLLAQIRNSQGRSDSARDILQAEIARATQERALLCELHAELARQLDASGLYEDAMRHYEQACRLDPGWIDARFGYAETLLRQGQFAKGWVHFEATRGSRYAQLGQPPVPPEFFWDGKDDLRGQHVVVIDEMGLGDAIQFFRYVPLLQARGAKLSYVTAEPLLRLFRHSAPFASFIPGLSDGMRFNYVCLSHSLPGAFRTTLETIPGNVPYLAAEPELVERWVSRLGTPGPLRVGLSWSGDAKHLYDYRRSIPAELFLRLADIPGVTAVSLQRPVRPSDQPALEQRPAIPRLGEEVTDFADTAAIVAGLDLVVTVDTAVAHLAGALGKPVWVVIGQVPDWRWMLGREDSPWYPSMRLFRQDRPDDWAGVLQRVGGELAALASSRGAG